MEAAVHTIIEALKGASLAKLAGAVKTFPFRELMQKSRLLQATLRSGTLAASQTRRCQSAHDTLQHILAKRMDAAQTLIKKFAETSPEIIALSNSVFALVPFRDVLEDVKTAFGASEELSKKLTTASTNILEAVNIEIQQRFYDVRPETIALHYSGAALESYRKLLKNFLAHIDVDSDIFKIYKTITRNIIDGSRIYESQVHVASGLCDQIFQTTPPAFQRVLDTFTTEELEARFTIVHAVAAMLDRDITMLPSMLEFSRQCQQILQAIAEHATGRKALMRKATRVLQLSHYFSSIAQEKIAENATASLMLCLKLFEDTRVFLLNQQLRLDISLNLKSIEDAQIKVREGLRYRQRAIRQLFQDILRMTSEDLSFASEKCLGNSHLLLQEIQQLMEEYLHRPAVAPPFYILMGLQTLRKSMGKLHEAITISRKSPIEAGYQPWEIEQTLPSLSKFYDEKVMALLQKALKVGSLSVIIEDSGAPQHNFLIPTEMLQEYIESFFQAMNPS